MDEGDQERNLLTQVIGLLLGRHVVCGEMEMPLDGDKFRVLLREVVEDDDLWAHMARTRLINLEVNLREILEDQWPGHADNEMVARSTTVQFREAIGLLKSRVGEA